MSHNEQPLAHHGIKGQKWGVRRFQKADGSLTTAGKKRYKSGDHMDDNDRSDSSTTRRVKRDYNSMTDLEFRSKYQTSKETYRKRVNRYGDPYMNSPLAKLGKSLAKSQTLSKVANSEGQKKRAEKLHDKLVKKADPKAVADLKAAKAKAKAKADSVYQKNKERILSEISEYDKTYGKDFAKKFFENYDDIEMWDLYSPEELNFWD